MENTYWNRKGLYENEYREMWNKLVPLKNEAETLHGELLRMSGRLYYDYHNNGNWNMKEDVFCGINECDECHGTGYEDGYDDWDNDNPKDCFYCNGTGEGEEEIEVTLTNIAVETIEFLKKYIDKEILITIEDIILFNKTNDDKSCDWVYENMANTVIKYCLDNENKKLIN